MCNSHMVCFKIVTVLFCRVSRKSRTIFSIGVLIQLLQNWLNMFSIHSYINVFVTLGEQHELFVELTSLLQGQFPLKDTLTILWVHGYCLQGLFDAVLCRGDLTSFHVNRSGVWIGSGIKSVHELSVIYFTQVSTHNMKLEDYMVFLRCCTVWFVRYIPFWTNLLRPTIVYSCTLVIIYTVYSWFLLQAFIHTSYCPNHLSAWIFLNLV
jgi:hypothetical protein